jgi:hypothetical protein
MSIDFACHGFCAADAEPRISQAGKQWGLAARRCR